MSARRGDACLSCGSDRADPPLENCKYPPNHARAGVREDRWCPVCEKYRPTEDDYCTECGADT